VGWEKKRRKRKRKKKTNIVRKKALIARALFIVCVRVRKILMMR
jgi:hypothetical protein